MPTVSRSATHTTTPARPSISPLSTPSKTFGSSPIATRDATMKDTAVLDPDEADDTSLPSDAEMAEQHDDRSSSLSDPEDDNEDVEDDDGVDEDALNGDEPVAHRMIDDDDSEAETERLDQTPQKLRRHADGLGRTPSKLSQAATAEEDLSEPPSPLAIGAGAASSTSTVATVGQKRKRSETADSSLTSADSDLGESPRKKAHEMPSHELHDVDDALETAEQSTESAERVDDTPAVEDPRATPTVPTKALKGRGRKKSKKPKEAVEEPEIQISEEAVEVEEEPIEEKEAKTEEEIKAKREASSIYDDVTKQFRSFREKLTNERLATLTTDLQLLSASSCEHPEYLKQVACVDARLQKQRSEAHAFYNYRLRCIRERTLGERSQLHSQFYQSVREVREDVLYKLGEDWYAIQKERRQSHQEKDEEYIYKFPTNKKAQLRTQAKYNQEVSVLSGVAKWVGFPAAPDLGGAEGDNFEDDMKAMKLSKRVHQPTAPPRQPFYPGPAVTALEQNERIAHERFIEQNPWARPQAPIHTHGTPGISHTPDWAEASTGGHSSAKHLIRNLNAQIHRAASPYATPITQKRPLPEHGSSAGTVAMNSDGMDPPSSVLAAPPRIESLGQPSSGLASPLTFPKHRPNGAEAAGFRNFSNLSAASTIEAPDAAPRGPGVLELSYAPSVSHAGFDPGQLHRRAEERREVYSHHSFRPLPEGAFGTPAPLPPGANAHAHARL